MAEKKEPHGGYDREFVCEVPDRFVCQICTKVLRDPHLAVCCGQHFCESCLNTRQGKESCPHCHAEGESFNHVVHKGLRGEINQLEIRCSNHGEGCLWIGEMGALKAHLESDRGCGYVIVNCPNKCRSRARGLAFWAGGMTTMKRKDLDVHITCECYLRPYQCEFCGHEDTYEAITGKSLLNSVISFFVRNHYGGHQAECPEAPLTCPNECGSNKIKRKDMETHRSLCPQETVECPFAEAGCKEELKRCKLETHVTSNQQQHLLLVMKDYKETKRELREVKGTLTTAVRLLRQGTEADKETIDYIVARSSRLMKRSDSVEVLMRKFSEYRRSGKVWHSPPFYYREGYKMCLAVYANGVGKGAGTHASVMLILLKGEHEVVRKHQRPVEAEKCHSKFCALKAELSERQVFNMCQYQPLSQYSEAEKELNRSEIFCTHQYIASKLVNDCLIFNIMYNNECNLKVSVK